jgi:hypothetical protein
VEREERCLAVARANVHYWIWPDVLMPNTDEVRLALIVLEVALWALTAVYIIFGGQWWHFSSGAAGAVVVRALRKKYYGRPPHDERGLHRKIDV